MQMAATTFKDDTNYWEALFDKKEPQGSGLDTLFKKDVSDSK